MGWLEDYVDYARQVTDAPIEFHRFVGLATLSATLEGKVWFRFGDKKVKPNLYVILLAPSSRFRKTTALEIGKNIVLHVCSQVVLPNEWTPEKLVEHLQNQPAGIFFCSEFATVNSHMGKDYMMGAKSFLTEVFDNPPLYVRKTKHNSVRIENPCVSMLAATTTEWFLQRVKEGDLFGGWLPRFLFVPAFSKGQLLPFPKPVDGTLRNRLVLKLKKYRESFNSRDGHEVSFSTDALASYEDWFREFEAKIAAKDNNPALSAFQTRLEMYCLKLALLVHLSETRTLEVSKQAMEAAQEVVWWLWEQLRRLAEEEFAFTKGDRQRKTVLRLIKSNPGISHSSLLRKSHLSTRELKEAVETLVQEERVRPDEEKTSSKPRRVYHARGPQETSQ